MTKPISKTERYAREAKQFENYPGIDKLVRRPISF